MVQNKIIQAIIDNWKDIGWIGAGIWALFVGGKKLYFKTFLPLKIWFNKMNAAADQLQYNGGSSTKDMVKKLVDGQEIIIKKMDIVGNRQTAMFEISPVGMFENDASGKCIRANMALCDLFGTTQNKMLGYGWLSYIKNPEHEREMFEQAIETDNEITRDYVILYGTKHEIEIPATYIAYIKRDEQGSIINVTGKVTKRELDGKND